MALILYRKAAMACRSHFEVLPLAASAQTSACILNRARDFLCPRIRTSFGRHSFIGLMKLKRRFIAGAFVDAAASRPGVDLTRRNSESLPIIHGPMAS
jgi:hypothetical protein